MLSKRIYVLNNLCSRSNLSFDTWSTRSSKRWVSIGTLFMVSS